MKTVQEIENFNCKSPFEAYDWLCDNEQNIRKEYGCQAIDELFKHNEYYCNEYDNDSYLEAQEQAFKSRMDY